MSEIILFIIVCLICSFLLLVLLKRKDKTIKRTPIALAKQMLRYPERSLIDIPLYASALHGSMNYEFLLETESALASMGGLITRRQFLIYLAEVIKSPSKDSVKELTNFLFHVAPETFRDALRWDGRCDNAMRFLEFMQYLIEYAEKGKNIKGLQKISKKKRGHSSKKLLKELQGVDAKIMQEWLDLQISVDKMIASWQVQSHNKIGEQNRNSHSDFVSLPDEEKISHLLPLLIAVRKVYQSVTD